MRGPVTREVPMDTEDPGVYPGVPGRINYSTIRHGIMGADAEQRLNMLMQRDRDRKYAQETRRGSWTLCPEIQHFPCHNNWQIHLVKEI